MEPVLSITRLGFRKWYERQLMDGHIALITCVVCMVAVAICLEEFTFPAPLPTTAALLGAIVAASIVGRKCGWRYHRVLTAAWRCGESSVCRRCQTYKRFTILTSGRVTPTATGNDPNPVSDVWMNVAGKKSGHTWRLPD